MNKYCIKCKAGTHEYPATLLFIEAETSKQAVELAMKFYKEELFDITIQEDAPLNENNEVTFVFLDDTEKMKELMKNMGDDYYTKHFLNAPVMNPNPISVEEKINKGSSDICNLINDLLDEYKIKIPKKRQRDKEDDCAPIYGKTYFKLYEQIREVLINHFNKSE